MTFVVVVARPKIAQTDWTYGLRKPRRKTPRQNAFAHE